MSIADKIPLGNSSNIRNCPYMNSNDNKENCITDINFKSDNITQNNINSALIENNVSTSKKKCLFVELRKEASYLNLCTFYLVQFSYVCFFSFMDAMQTYLLIPHAGYFKEVTSKNMVEINTNLLFFDNLYLVLCIYLFGAFHDIIGRKLVLSFGFLLISISLFLYPFAGNVYPNLLLLRLLFSNGVCCVVTQPLLADYVKHSSKGFSGGITAVVSGLGALFSVYVLLKIGHVTSLKEAYIITGGFSLFVSLFCLIGVKNVSIVSVYNKNKNCLQRFKNIFVKIKDGSKEIASNTKLIFGILTNTQARMNSIIMTLYLNLYVSQFYEKRDYFKSYGRAMTISGIGSSIGLISAVLFGFIYDKAKTKVVLIINNFAIFVGYFMLFIDNDPRDSIAFAVFGLASFGFYGLTTCGFIIVNKNVSCNARGAVMGLNSLFGAIGICFIIKVGPIIAEYFKIAVFIISGSISLLVLALLCIPKISKDLKEYDDLLEKEEVKEEKIISNALNDETTFSSNISESKII